MTASSVGHRRKLVWECFLGSSIVSVEGWSAEAAKPGLCANTVVGAEAGPEILTLHTIPNTSELALRSETLGHPGSCLAPVRSPWLDPSHWDGCSPPRTCPSFPPMPYFENWTMGLC